MSMETDVIELKTQMLYVVRMLEELTLSLNTKGKDAQASEMLGVVRDFVTNDPHIKQHPAMKETMDKLFKVTG